MDRGISKRFTGLHDLGMPRAAPIGTIVEGAPDGYGNHIYYIKTPHGWEDWELWRPVTRQQARTPVDAMGVQATSVTPPQQRFTPPPKNSHPTGFESVRDILENGPRITLNGVCVDDLTWEEAYASDSDSEKVKNGKEEKPEKISKLGENSDSEKVKIEKEEKPRKISELGDNSDSGKVKIEKEEKPGKVNNLGGKTEKTEKSEKENQKNVSELCSEMGKASIRDTSAYDAVEEFGIEDVNTKESFQNLYARHHQRVAHVKRKHWKKMAAKHGLSLGKSAHSSVVRTTRYLCTRLEADTIIPILKEKRLIRNGVVRGGIEDINNICRRCKLNVQSDTFAPDQTGHSVLDALRSGVEEVRNRMSDNEWRFVSKTIDIFAAYRLLQSGAILDKAAAVFMALKTIVSEEYFARHSGRLISFLMSLLDPARYVRLPNIDPDTGVPINITSVGDRVEVQAGMARTLYDLMDKFDPEVNWIAPPTLAASIDVFMALMHLGFLKSYNPETGKEEDCVSLEWLNTWSCGILREKITRVFNSKFEAGHAIFSAAKLFLNVAVHYEETGVFDPAGWCTMKNKQLFTRYAQVIGARPDAVDGNLGVGKAFTSDIEYMDELNDLITCFTRLTDKSKKAAETNMYAMHLEKLIDIREEIISQGRANYQRIKPFTYMVFGTTSSMKSTVTNAVWKTAARANGISEDPTNCGTTNMSDPYHSEIRGQEVILIDDYMNETKDGMAPGVNPVRKLLDWSSNNPVQLVGAAIQDKGRRFAKFKILGLSAYDMKFKAHTLSYQPNAAYRRIEMYIETKIKPEFRDMNGQPDRAKTAGLGIFPDIFVFNIYDYVISADGKTGSFNCHAGMSNLNNEQMLAEVERRSRMHFAFQNALVNKLNDVNAWHCPHGKIPGACRQCAAPPPPPPRSVSSDGSSSGPSGRGDDVWGDDDPPDQGLGLPYEIHVEHMESEMNGTLIRERAEALLRRANEQDNIRESVALEAAPIIDNMADAQQLAVLGVDSVDELIAHHAQPEPEPQGFSLNPVVFARGYINDRMRELEARAGQVAASAVRTALTNAEVSVNVSVRDRLSVQANEIPGADQAAGWRQRRRIDPNDIEVFNPPPLNPRPWYHPVDSLLRNTSMLYDRFWRPQIRSHIPTSLGSVARPASVMPLSGPFGLPSRLMDNLDEYDNTIARIGWQVPAYRRLDRTNDVVNNVVESLTHSLDPVIEPFRTRTGHTIVSVGCVGLGCLLSSFIPGPWSWATLRAMVCGVWPAVLRSNIAYLGAYLPTTAATVLSTSWLIPTRFWSTDAWRAKLFELKQMWRTSGTRSELYKATLTTGQSVIDYAALFARTGAMQPHEMMSWSGKLKLGALALSKASPFMATTAIMAVNDVGVMALTQGLAYTLTFMSPFYVLPAEALSCLYYKRAPSVAGCIAHLKAPLHWAQCVVETAKVPTVIEQATAWVSNKFAARMTSANAEFLTYLTDRYPGMTDNALSRIMEGRDPDSATYANEFLAYKTRKAYFLYAFGGLALTLTFLSALWKLYKLITTSAFTTKEAIKKEEEEVPGWYLNTQLYVMANLVGDGVLAIDKSVQKANPTLKKRIVRWAVAKYSIHKHPLDWQGPDEDDRWAEFGIEYTQSEFDADIARMLSWQPLIDTLRKRNVVAKGKKVAAEIQSSVETFPTPIPGEAKSSFVSMVKDTAIIDPAISTMTEDQILNAIKRNILWVSIKTKEGTICECHALAVGGHDFLVPAHAISHNATVSAKSAYAVSQGSFGLSFVATTTSELMLDVGGDYVLVRLMSTPVFRDITSLFPITPFQQPCPNSFLIHARYGQIGRTDVATVPQLGPPAMLMRHGKSYKEVQQYVNPDYPIDTYVGLCGAVWVTRVSRQSKLTIHSLHIAGNAGVNFGSSVPMTSNTLLMAKAKLDEVQFVPASVRPSWQKEGELHFRHPINFLEDNEFRSGELISVSDSVPSHYRNTIKETVIAQPLRELLGWPVSHKPPDHPNSMKHIQQALQEMTRLEDRFDSDLLQMAMDDVSDKILTRCTKFNLEEVVSPLPTVVAISGADGVVGIDALNPKTSMGFPIGGPKSKHLIPVEEDIPGITRPMEFTHDIMCEIEELEDRLKQGVKGNFVYRASTKMEPMKAHKEHLRIFTCANAQMGVLFRKYFLPIFRILHLDALGCGNTLGINVYSLDWDNLARSFRSQERMIAGDYKNFDQFLPPRLIQMAGRILIKVAEQSGYTKEQLRLMDTLVYEIAHPYVEVAQNIFSLFLHVSGHHGTLVFNNLMNMMLWRYVYYSRMFYTRFEDVPLELRASRLVDESVCGDDHILSVDESVEGFDQVVMREVLGSIGIVYTDDSKQKDFTARFVHLEDLTYLSRYFKKHPDLQRYVSPLKLSSLQKSYCMVDLGGDLTEQQLLVMNIETNDTELLLHGRREYDRIGRAVRLACAKAGIDCPPFVPYETKLAAFLKRCTIYSHGFVVQADVFDYYGVGWHLRNVFMIDTITNHHYYFVGLESQRTFVPTMVIDAIAHEVRVQKGYPSQCPYTFDWQPESDGSMSEQTVVYVRGNNTYCILPPTLALLVRRALFHERIPWSVWESIPLMEAELADADTAYYWASMAWPFPCEQSFARRGEFSSQARDEWFTIHRER